MSYTTRLLAVVVAAWLVPWGAARWGMRVSADRGETVRNYRGEDVPLGLGWAWMAFALAYLVLLAGAGEVQPIGWVCLLVGGAALLGYFDDRFGRTGPKGLKGHLTAAAYGRLSTGLIKLVGLVGLAIWTAWATLMPDLRTAEGWVTWVLAVLVIAGTANLLNLLDLRPGRASKAYLLLAFGAWLAMSARLLTPPDASGIVARLIPLLIVVGPAAVTLPADLRERGMLGDMGANAAGAYAGWLLTAALAPSLWALGTAAALIVGLNLISERVSFSAVIERNGALRWFDSLGRKTMSEPKRKLPDGDTRP